MSKTNKKKQTTKKHKFTKDYTWIITEEEKNTLSFRIVKMYTIEVRKSNKRILGK